MKITTKYSKGGKAVGVKKKSATMHIPATPAGSNKARIAAIGTPKKSAQSAFQLSVPLLVSSFIKLS